MDGLTRQVGAFVSSIDRDAIPDLAIEGARIGIVDCIGVMIAGAGERAPAIVANLQPDLNTDEGVPLVPSGRRLSSADAALVNGVAAHVLDYDDVALAGHPSTVLAPAILAEGWALRRSGAEILAAYVAGYETWALLDDIEPGAYHDLGFHPTAVLGTLSTAAACARLHRLTSDQATYAVAVGASLASGLVGNFGTMTKSLHAGRAAQSGVLAARLAKAGYTASQDVLEHRSGFMLAHSPSRAPDVTERDYELGKQWRLPIAGIHVKRYPVCYGAHRSIDAMLDLIETHGVRADDIDTIHVQIGDTQRLMLRNYLPQTGLAAKFSIEFALASALLSHRVGVKELTDDYVRRPDVQAMMKRVRCTTTSELIQDWDQPFAPADLVSVVLKSGRELKADPVTHPKGSWQRRMDTRELRAKFIDCADAALGEDGANQLFDQLWAIDALQSVRDLKMFAAQRKVATA